MRYDVNASCYELDGNGADGAYDLHLRNATAEEVAQAILKVLSGPWGISQGPDGATQPSRLEINIGPAGSADDLPL